MPEVTTQKMVQGPGSGHRTIALHFGALSPSIAVQLAEQGIEITKLADDLRHWDRDADAIVRLKIRGLIPDSVARKAEQKLVRKIMKKLNGQ